MSALNLRAIVIFRAESALERAAGRLRLMIVEA